MSLDQVMNWLQPLSGWIFVAILVMGPLLGLIGLHLLDRKFAASRPQPFSWQRAFLFWALCVAALGRESDADRLKQLTLMLVSAVVVLAVVKLAMHWRSSNRPFVGQTGTLVSDIDVGEKAHVRLERRAFGGQLQIECIGLEAMPQGVHVKVESLLSGTPLVKKSEVTPQDA